MQTSVDIRKARSVLTLINADERGFGEAELDKKRSSLVKESEIFSFIVSEEYFSSLTLLLLQYAPRYEQFSLAKDICGVAGSKWPSVLKM